MKTATALFATSLSLLLAGCRSGEAARSDLGERETRGAKGEASTGTGPSTIDADDTEAAAFAGIAPDERARFTGTEPFWGGQVTGSALTYTTPENQDGSDIAVTRFAGRGGVSWSGTYRAARFVLAVTPGECSDGMSDRTYPFVATLEVAGEQRSGCAWTDRKPFGGPANP